ncbi:hypothetical protein V1525DRAFT_419832 [Lipomyces kononenkoae]|uniref:Uncharacterized protein n=1 Tax=Lipomyces kononenkoae TaxID=34357 RepID=A0ACC3SZR0_LIPKO
MQTTPGRADHTTSSSPTFTITIVTSTSYVSPQGSAGSSTSFPKSLIVVFALLIVMMAVGGCFLFRSGGVTKGDEPWNEQISSAMRRWQGLTERFIKKKPREYPTSDDSMEKLERRDGYIVSRISDEQSADDETSDDVRPDIDPVDDSLSNSTSTDVDGLSDKFGETPRANNVWTDTPIPRSQSGSEQSDEETKSLTPPPKISTHALGRQEGYYYVPIAPPHLTGIHHGYYYPLTYINGRPGQTDSSTSMGQHQSLYDQGGIGVGTYNNGYMNGYTANNNNMPTAYGNTGMYGYYHIPPQYYPYQRAYI